MCRESSSSRLAYGDLTPGRSSEWRKMNKNSTVLVILIDSKIVKYFIEFNYRNNGRSSSVKKCGSGSTSSQNNYAHPNVLVHVLPSNFHYQI